MPVFLITITREKSHIGVLSTTDEEFAKQLKALLEERGEYQVKIKKVPAPIEE